MVTLTTTFVEKKYLQTQLNRSLTKEIDKHHVKKLTHLFMNNKFISDIGNLIMCAQLRVIYLHNNCISKIENLEFAKNLTELYLQHNNLSKIENLDSLTNLKKLYLGHNNIAIIEGLENLLSLKELHVEKQNMGPGESLCFEPRSLVTLATCLQILNITSNRISDLGGIRNLKTLEVLDAKDNLLRSIEDLTNSISSLPSLRRLFLQGNPVTAAFRYRENLIANHDKLVCLDGKKISENCRDFMKKFKLERQLQQTRKKSKLTLSEDITNSLNLPSACKRSISRAMFQHVSARFPLSLTPITGDLNSQFPPWKSNTAVKGLKDNHTLPRPFWKTVSRTKGNKTFLTNGPGRLTLPLI